MVERFNELSRRAVVRAQEESRQLQHRHLGGEHLLLGLLAVPGGAAERALTACGVRLPEARAAVAGVVPGCECPPQVDRLAFTPGAKRTLAGALREVLRRSGQAIGTGHLLLALLAEPEPDAGVREVLTAAGADPGRLRAAVEPLLGSEPDEVLPSGLPGSGSPGSGSPGSGLPGSGSSGSVRWAVRRRAPTVHGGAERSPRAEAVLAGMVRWMGGLGERLHSRPTP